MFITIVFDTFQQNYIFYTGSFSAVSSVSITVEGVVNQNFYNALCLYRKFPKYSDTQKIVVIILKFELCGSTIE